MAYKLNDKHRELLRNKRKMKKKSAESVSEQIYKSKGWLAMVERGRIKSIALDDLKMLLAILDGSDSDATVRAFLDAADPESAQYTMVNRKSFSQFNPIYYASRNFEKELHHFLTNFNNEVRRQMETAVNDRRRFFLLRSIYFLSKNIKHASDHTIVLNSAPIFLTLEDSTLEYTTMQTALDLFDKCRNYVTHKPAKPPELRFNAAADDMHQRFTSTLELLSYARSCLIRMLSMPVIDTGASGRYNEIIRTARNQCDPVVAQGLQFPELDLDEKISDSIIGIQLAKLEQLREELTSMYDQYKANETAYEIQMLEEKEAREQYYLEHPGYDELEADEFDPETLQLINEIMRTVSSEQE